VSAVAAFKGYVAAGKAGSGSDLSFSAVARDRFNRFVSSNMPQSNTPEKDPTSGRSEAEGVAWGPFDNKLEAVLEGSTEGALLYYLRSLFGNVTSTQQAATAAYQHVFTRADALASADRLTFEQKYGTKAESEIANGVVKKYRYDFTQKGMVRHGISALLANPAYSSSPTSATLPAVGTTRISQPMHTFSLAGVTRKVRSGWVEIDGGNMDDDFSAPGRARIDAERGPFEVSFELEMLFTDLTDRRRFWDSAAATTPGNVATFYECNVKGEHPTVIASTYKHTIEFDMDAVSLEAVDLPMQGKDFITERVRGSCIYDATNGAVTAKVTNTQTTA
jgi:hypothetical protein